MLLSLIIPFFNSKDKSKRLLETLAGLKQKDVEFILVNDGSSDGTYCMLEEFKASIPDSNVTLIDQDNKGPGGARNSGLKFAKGDYVWFVDSDDDINVEAIDIVRQHYDEGYDFIDFNIESLADASNTMGLKAGEYVVNDKYRLQLIKNFGRIWSKVLRRDFLISNEILYPEYTLYEDNPLLFIYPFFVKKFLKSEVMAYIHHLEFESITRTKVNPKTFDRLQTSIYGLERGLKLTKNKAEIGFLEKRFIEKYLIVTTETLLTKKPSKSWLVTWRMMKQYRDLAKELNIESTPFDAMKVTTYNNKVKAYFTLQWMLSHLILTDQANYFDNIHENAWKR